MRIAFIGAGGVGASFGAPLARDGHEVTFVARGRHLAAIRERGLTVRTPEETIHLPRPEATDDVGAVKDQDLVVVAVKLWDTEDVARRLAPVVGERTTVVSVQNGVTRDETLARHLPAGSIIGGTCYVSAYIDEPGVVTRHGAMQRMVLGELDGSDSPRLRAIHQALSGSVDLRTSDDIQRLLWEKFVFLVGLSALTAATREPIGVVREDPRSRALLRAVMTEAADVARARGVRLAADFVDERLAFCDTLPASMTASMAGDLAHRRRLELPWLSGGVVDLARAAGVDAPANAAIVGVLAPHQDGTRTP